MTKSKPIPTIIRECLPDGVWQKGWSTISKYTYGPAGARTVVYDAKCLKDLHLIGAVRVEFQVKARLQAAGIHYDQVVVDGSSVFVHIKKPLEIYLGRG